MVEHKMVEILTWVILTLLFYISVYLSIYPSVDVPIYLSISLSYFIIFYMIDNKKLCCKHNKLLRIYLSIHQSINPSIYQYIILSIHLAESEMCCYCCSNKFCIQCRLINHGCCICMHFVEKKGQTSVANVYF